MIFLNSASSVAALVFYLPGVCTHIDTEGEQRKARVWNIFKNDRKNTIINEHPVDNVRDSWSFLTGFLPYLTSVLSRYVNALQPGRLGGPEFWDFRAFSFLFFTET